MSFTEPLLSEGSAGLQWFKKAFRQDSLRPNRLLRETESLDFEPVHNTILQQRLSVGKERKHFYGCARGRQIKPYISDMRDLPAS